MRLKVEDEEGWRVIVTDFGFFFLHMLRMRIGASCSFGPFGILSPWPRAFDSLRR